MENENRNIIELTEIIRLSYSRVLKTYLQIHNEYRQMKIRITKEGVNKKFHSLDQLFYDGIGKLKWDTIQSLMPPNFEKKIKAEYKMLCENEIKLCCLLFFDVNTSDISNILPYKQNSVYVITNRIKRKTGIKDISGSLDTFLFTLE